MVKQFLYNIALNIGILVLAYCAIAAYHGKQYAIIAGACIGVAALIYLKVRLAKNVKQMLKIRKK
ncbi:hypothetical protein GCM10023231_35800 [Olivibacter ginsenosidimutans]|uniref:Sortase n=1 Tax=Olivibacter ginsenosidimutans TaxID=1176537 RepID=A0ABP9C1V6_9SPHI